MGQSELERLTALEVRDKQRENDISEIFKKLDLIKDRLMERPSWAVTIILTSLVTLSASLIIIILQ